MEHLDIPLERDGFMRRLIGELSGKLEQIVGEEEASGFVSLVGLSMGAYLDRLYRRTLGREKLSRDEVGQVLVDLKRRIQGDFSVESSTADRIVLHNTRCPFAEHAFGHPSLCMMTSNVFGTITAEHLGYARVDIEKAIARGDGSCRVVIHLTTNESPGDDGREYFRE